MTVRSWRQFTAQDGLPANGVVAIDEDSAGWLWFGTEDGAARVDPATLNLSSAAWPTLPTATPPAKATREPTPTQAARVATPTAQRLPTPTPCGLSPAEAFAPPTATRQISDRLGCPSAEATAGRAAFQPFEAGLMIWRMDNREIDVLAADGSWQRTMDTWDESSRPMTLPSPHQRGCFNRSEGSERCGGSNWGEPALSWAGRWPRSSPMTCGHSPLRAARWSPDPAQRCTSYTPTELGRASKDPETRPTEGQEERAIWTSG